MSKIFGSLGFVPEDLDELRPGKSVSRLAFTATNAYRITIELLNAKETRDLAEALEEPRSKKKR